MNLKKIIPAIILAAGLGACDNIGPDDRFVELPPVEAKRMVLLEEFTGQMCMNCPVAQQTIKDLTTNPDKFPTSLIVVSIHAGGDAFSIGEGQYPGVVGLRNDEGERYAADNNVKTFPSGVVNRCSGVLDKEQWEAKIRELVEKPSEVDLSVEGAIEDGQIKIKTLVQPHANLAANLQLWVVEDGITAMQLQPDGSVKTDAEHNHVFRAAVNGHSGEPLHLKIREDQTLEHYIAVKDHWTAEHMSVVAFLFNGDGVLQAAICHLDGAH